MAGQEATGAWGPLGTAVAAKERAAGQRMGSGGSWEASAGKEGRG